MQSIIIFETFLFLNSFITYEYLVNDLQSVLQRLSKMNALTEYSGILKGIIVIKETVKSIKPTISQMMLVVLDVNKK